ncbi:F0F1 ATP synthase subunit gamma [Varunaivibrio sulfuroxidans]|uniref:ATP synthase gamma chain n=1 Tax=Varunaivibrio sulfuroxidans TaxID=1773489 RepID=A0A4R3JFX1_9PROT|nr:F0F1 ATP synthase subunit gamma [Varunaivibrio sulfuroxidans]TCS63590.1 ATP synthase F1 subcomplex gamma subunit [Varunaivibrio sulfuroxidans]WES30267.1 F0F1 ATP synthase subunit gamma [Varunaivibrio sulfuroxidans]
MPSLKDLKVRINSVKSTRKITSAMKMVAAAKLRRAQEAAEAARAYSLRMDRMLGSLASSFKGVDGGPALLSGSGRDQTHLIVVCTSNRGLCGGFNATIVRDARRMIAELKGAGKDVKLLCVGTKGRGMLKRDFGDDIVETLGEIGKKGVTYEEADSLAQKVTVMFENGDFDVCHVVFNRFQSAMTQVVTRQQLIPFMPGDDAADAHAKDNGPVASYLYEPDESEILDALLPRNLAVQFFQALLENSASEHGSRMTAMDSASRNASDMIDGLTLTFNRTRQAYITKELIEIISGAEAL